MKHFRIASDSEDIEYDRPAFLPRALEPDRFSDAFSASADEFTDVEPDRFANPFDANPSRISASPAEESSAAEEEPTSEQEQEIKENISIALHAQEKLTNLTSRANDFVQNQIMPAAHRAIETSQPVAIMIGNTSFKLAVAMAREVLTDPFVQAGLVYGVFQT